MSGACGTEEKTETRQIGRDRNAQGAGEESARPECGDFGVQGGSAQRADQLLTVMLRMGEAMIDCGAEILRVEDTLNRIGFAYGACSMNVFVITSSIVITMEYAPGLQRTQTKRIRGTVGNDMTELEALNELSREICAGQPPVEEFRRRLREVLPRENARISFLHDASYHALLRKRASLASKRCADAGMRAQGQVPGWQSQEPERENSRSGAGLYTRKRIVSLTGYVLAAGAFAVFFGGTALDGLMAAAAGALTWLFVETISCADGAYGQNHDRRHHASGAGHYVYECDPGHAAGRYALGPASVLRGGASGRDDGDGIYCSDLAGGADILSGMEQGNKWP